MTSAALFLTMHEIRAGDWIEDIIFNDLGTEYMISTI